MAIFKYKKPNGSGGYSIEEMPVISNTYTEYVVKDATDGAKTIILTPLHTSESTGAGAFEDVVASVKLLSTDPTYAPSTSQQTITYDGNGFPKKITISAIPTTTKTYTSSATKQEYNFTTSTGFPTKVTINAIPSNGNKTITLSPGTLSSSLDPGYYGTISTSVKTYSTNPSYTPSTSAQNITYTASTGFPKGITISAIPTTTLTLKNNNTTYNIGSGNWSAGTYPTSITVQVPSDLPTPSSPPNDTIITTQNGTKIINAGYYTDDITITATFPSVSPNSNQSLTPNKTSYPIPTGYHANNRTVSVSTGTLTITDPSLTLSGSTASITISPTASGTWVNTYYPNKVIINFTNQSPSDNQSLIPSKSSFTIPTGYHATSNRTVSVSSGSKSITSNGTYYASTDGYYYSSVTVNVPGTTLANIEDSKEATESMILNGYKAYNDQGTLLTGSLANKGYAEITLTPSNFSQVTRSISGTSQYFWKYEAYSSPAYTKTLTLYLPSITADISSNGTYYLFGSSSSWGSVPTSLRVNVPTTSMTDSGALDITANGTYPTSGSSYYYSSVRVNVPETTSTYKVLDVGQFNDDGGVSWVIYYDNTGLNLVIDGNFNWISYNWAKLPDYTNASSWPWYDYRTQIHRIRIHGVRKIPKDCFKAYTLLDEIILDCINTIDTQAFINCGDTSNASSHQGSIIIGGAVKNLGSGCFQGNNFTRVVFTGRPNGTVSSNILAYSKIEDIYFPFSSSDSIVSGNGTWGAYGAGGSGTTPTVHPSYYA